MSKGLIFSIEEFTIYDGPGIRTSVFFKGCPLRCEWCHNPEGLSQKPQIAHSPNGCLHCGACKRVCPSPDSCILCGECIKVCPRGLIRISGEEWEAGALAEKLLRLKDFFTISGGGVTFSGGEVLYQPEFLLDLLRRTRGLHRAIETSGYASAEIFKSVIEECELIMFDLKVMDSELHRRYTGVSNKRILENFELLKASGKPFAARIPLIPGVNDNEENFRLVAQAVAPAKERGSVEILPYNAMAGAKYALVGREYAPSFDAKRRPAEPFLPLTQAGISFRVL